MRADGYEALDDMDDHGGVEGYVVLATAVNLANWLNRQTDATVVAALLEGLQAQPGARVAVLRSLWVDEDSQGQGRGRFWLDDFIERADATVVLLVADALESQRPGFVLPRFYEAAGFAKVIDTGTGPMMAYPSDQALALRERAVLAQASRPSETLDGASNLPSGRLPR